MMIQRIWRGWTSQANADAYERLLREQVFPGFAARGIAGLRTMEAWRREVGRETEFVTIMSFDDLRAVAEFAGDDPERSLVPEDARNLLARFDAQSDHYELVIPPTGPGIPEPPRTVGR